MTAGLHISLALLVSLGEVRNGIPRTSTNSRVDLTGDKWMLTGGVPARVPGTMYTALQRKATIRNPLYRDGDVWYAWVGKNDWTYSRNFTISPAAAAAGRILLVCEGLDTVATVRVNDHLVGQSDNMFVKSTFNITGVVKAGDNSLVVAFQSAVKEAAMRTNRSAYVIPPECPKAVQHGECHVNQLRKDQCSFSWDWGPSFPTQGIWKPIYIETFDSAVIKDLTAVVNKVDSLWQVSVEIYFNVIGSRQVKGQLQANISALNLTLVQSVTLSTSRAYAKVMLVVPKSTPVALWWPNGYGNQAMFDLNVTFVAGNDVSQRSIKVGFRTVELVQDPVSKKPQQGLTFYFRINGIPLYLKGSNWIPADSFQERITDQRLTELLQSAADVGINSMRVWGGGVYESETFYRLCDELGIMVWQDFMFSVALYPSYTEYLDSVAEEVTYQVRRLKYHPSIILWAGNNENEKGLRQNWFDTEKHYDRYYKDYISLYVTTIKPIVEAEDSSRQYITSSPTNGKESEREGYVATDPGSELYGDIHFYDYLADQWNWTVFRIPRMASEYGIQAWCLNESLAKVFDPSDFKMDSAMVDHRQHHEMGNTEMSLEVALHMKMPESTDDKEKFADFIYLTQINQAMSMRTQTEHYRRYQNKLRPDGRGLTMGALYWQLNDIWQAPTWASIDYEGRWKMLHYYARSFFNQQLISPYMLDYDTLDVFLVVDQIPVKETRQTVSGGLRFQPMFHFYDILKSAYPPGDVFKTMLSIARATVGYLKVDMYSYSSFTPLFSWLIPYRLTSTAASVYRRKLSTLLQDSKCPSPKQCFLYFTTTDSQGMPMSTSWMFLTYPKNSQLPPAQTKIASLTKKAIKVFEIEVTTSEIALFVWLSAGNVRGYFSDNGFLMITPTMKITFYAYDNVQLLQLRTQLKVHSLVDVK